MEGSIKRKPTLSSRFLFLLSVCRFVNNDCSNNYNADNHEDTEHSRAHILEVGNKIHRIKLHTIYLPLTEEIENHTACDNGSDLTGNVNADRVHEQEVLGVFFKSHFVNDTS